MRRLHRYLIIGSVVLALAAGAYLTLMPGFGLPLAAATSPGSKREYMAAMLGLLVLAVAAMGFEWGQ